VDAQAAGVCDYLDGGLPVLLYLQGLRRERENGDGNDVPFDHVLGLVFCILVGVSDGNKKERHSHICTAVVGSSERLEESILERRAKGRQKRN
jgi:hypothetical protein